MKSYIDHTLSRIGIAIENSVSKVTVYDFVGIHIEGHKGLIDYNECNVVFRLKNKKIFVTGDKLSIKEISSDEIFIKGKICSIGAEDIG